MQNLYQSLFQDNSLPTPSILQTTTTKSMESSTTMISNNSLTTDPIEDPIISDDHNIEDIREDTENTFEHPPSRQHENINHLIQLSFSEGPLQALNDLDFGVARKDLDKDRKRFEWIQEEINYLQHYIQCIEKDADLKNRFSACLNHLRTEASTDVKKYFHPHHVVNSDRLKNGFNTALKKLN